MTTRFEVCWARRYRDGRVQLFIAPFTPELGTEDEEVSPVDEVLFEVALDATPADFGFVRTEDSGESWGESLAGVAIWASEWLEPGTIIDVEISVVGATPAQAGGNHE